METPPWKLIVPGVCLDLCKYKKSETDPTLYRWYSEFLESFTDYAHIFTDLKMAITQLRLLSVILLSSQNACLKRCQFLLLTPMQ